MAKPSRLLFVAGARPNFMKVAPVLKAVRTLPDLFSTFLVHTGQHYDHAMSSVFFDQLGIPAPDCDLGVGSDSQTRQTAAIMTAFEPVVLGWKPDLLVVVGDVNSTIACALVASKLGIAVAHVEAGLRSFDRRMPEEINRVLTDHLSDYLFVTEPSGIANLRAEGIDDSRVHFVGNVMIDTLLVHRESARALGMPARLGLTAGEYGMITLHRPSNVDDPGDIARLFGAIAVIAREVPFVFPVHPRTRKALDHVPIIQDLVRTERLQLVEPLGYLEFVGLMADCRLVVTDSGGVQEETTVLGVPCLTLRENTERPVTISEGTNRLVGTDPDMILKGWEDVRRSPVTGRVPKFWDGKAADRIVKILTSRLAGESTRPGDKVHPEQSIVK